MCLISPSDQQSVALMRVKPVFMFFQDLLMRLRETLQVRQHDPVGRRTAPFLCLLFLCAAVQTAFSVGKIQVSLRKRVKTKWTKLGQPLEFHNTFVLKKERGESPDQRKHWRRSRHSSRMGGAVWRPERPACSPHGLGLSRRVSELGGPVALLLYCV